MAIANRNDIERHGAQNFQDVANTLPGVNASAPPGFGGFVSCRGFTSSQVTQMFNGINVSGGLARPVDAWIYDRVELVGGPSPLINGDGSVGGSLNYVTNEVYVEFAHASPTYYLGTPRTFELAVQTRL